MKKSTCFKLWVVKGCVGCKEDKFITQVMSGFRVNRFDKQIVLA